MKAMGTVMLSDPPCFLSSFTGHRPGFACSLPSAARPESWPHGQGCPLWKTPAPKSVPIRAQPH